MEGLRIFSCFVCGGPTGYGPNFCQWLVQENKKFAREMVKFCSKSAIEIAITLCLPKMRTHTYRIILKSLLFFY
jgi:hypothetical protein